jgi:hypothetical protein
MASEGSKRVEISGFGDKCQITGVFVGTLSGMFNNHKMSWKNMIALIC